MSFERIRPWPPCSPATETELLIYWTLFAAWKAAWVASNAWWRRLFRLLVGRPAYRVPEWPTCIEPTRGGS